MTIEVNITGIENVKKKLNKINKTLKSRELKEYIAERCLKVVNRESMNKLSYNEEYIAHNKTLLGDDFILIYNDVKNDSGQYYSLMIEYGTGLFAEQESVAQSNIFSKTGGLYWYVPEEEGQRLMDYNYPRYETEDGRVFYQVFGQTPKHIYEDSAKMIKRNIKRWIYEYIKSNKE